MRKITLLLALLGSLVTRAQVVFNETFGAGTSRQTTPYMPLNSFTWGDPTGTPEQKRVDDNYYTVASPGYIRDAWPVPDWWWWTGPEPVGNTWGGANNPATPNNNADHTGDPDGAVLVVNAGVTLNGFYERPVTLATGKTYRLSLWFYLVNSYSSISMQIRDVNTHNVLGSLNTGIIFTSGAWQQFNYDFAMPSSCSSGNTQAEVYLVNTTSLVGGNDYYVDDIQLETIPDNGAAAITCPSAVLAVDISNFTAVQKNSSVELQWLAQNESGIKNYVIEKSTDGIHFSPVITQTAYNNSSLRQYTVTDNSIVAVPVVYYRLVTEEMNGSTKRSSVVVVHITADGKAAMVKVYPQPSADGRVTAEWNTDGVCTAILYNTNGTRLQKWENLVVHKIVINNLPAGIFILKIWPGNTGAASLTSKFIVSR
ncbi:MAG: T9SS type A sorting domain-containing protein [Bacteroidetes bacterium]|nr:T9SS type A sorting domain-containing protein [Bacteroidota bacterium]